MRVLPVALAVLILAACSAAPRRNLSRLSDDAYPGVLLPPSALGADVLWRQRVTAQWQDPEHPEDPARHGERSFDAALQKQGNVLTLIGISPLGSTGFAVTLEGGDVRLVNNSDEELPFPPRFILLDVERVFFPWLAGAGTPNGERSGNIEGEHVVEVWRGGQLVERRFTRPDGSTEGTIRVLYEGGTEGRLAPPRATLDNGWLGYRLTIETLEETRLPPAARVSRGS